VDQFLLHAAVAEAAARLVEHEVARVSHLGRQRYLIRFATSSRDNLLVSVRPDLPRLHLLKPRQRLREEPPDRFASYLDQEIGGAVLASLEKRPWDRVVELLFRLPRRDDGAVARRLVVELVGRSANLLLLEPGGGILGYCRDLRSEFRAPVVGTRYQPPPGREAFDDLPLGPEALPLVRERFGDPVAFLSRVSPLLAADLGLIGADKTEMERRLGEILEAVRSGEWDPVVYSPRPLGELTETDPLGRDELVVSPLPLLSPSRAGGHTAVVTSFRSPSEAAEAVFGLLERQRDFKDLKDHHGSLVRKEIGRLETLIRKLETELRAARACEEFRHYGEALLASLGSARVEGGTARVPDPYDPVGPALTIPIDPARSLQENAQLHFGRYKKAKRGLATIERRLEASRARLEEWRSLVGPAGSVGGPEDLERLREAMARLGLVHAPRPAKSAVPKVKEAPTRVRRHTTPDGFTILVGKSGEENDTLTFRVASPWDFWLHAADRPGAHVVVRNPQRLKSLPESVLRAAAEIAAFYSGGRKEGRVEVHYTQRKHVHKRKGMPSGQVILRRFRTTQVTPRLPVPSFEDI
jgi:predicted ribosome quality control (RQC) complex YloA/Tae2 family protein